MYELSYFADFDRTSDAERPAYVARELRRIVADEQPLLTTILRSPDDDAKSLALSLLRDNATELGDVVFEEPPTAFRLRLAADATPPDRDPQGRKLSKDRVGKVLVAKIGNKGGRLPEKVDPKVAHSFSGPRRQVLVQGGADLYETADVTREWRSFAMRHATIILKTWGLGVQTQRCLSHMVNGELVEGQSFYLVEEMPQARADAPSDNKKTSKRAADAA